MFVIVIHKHIFYNIISFIAQETQILQVDSDEVNLWKYFFILYYLHINKFT